jgi:predicted N-acetyltransferase YhbS
MKTNQAKVSSTSKSTSKAQPERRRQSRTHLLGLDNVSVEAKDEKKNKLKFTAHSMSSFGALIRHPIHDSINHLALGSFLEDLSIQYNQIEVGGFQKAKICYTKREEKFISFGISFLIPSSPNANQTPILERRKSRRVSTKDGFHAFASAKHPFIYDQTLSFRVLNISNEGAMLLFTPSGHPLLKGAVLEKLEILLPTVGVVHATAKILSVTTNDDKSELRLGVRFTEVGPQFGQLVSKYLLGFGVFMEESPLNALRSAGFSPKYLKTHVDFSHVTTDDEYAQVLQLRREAYGRAKKIEEDTRADDMKDIFDFNSLILIAKVKDQVVGSVRLTYCKHPNDEFELDHSIEIPNWIPRGQSVEISRLCVRTDFEHTDLVLGLIERCTEMANKMGMQYVISSCVDSMVPYYKKLGFKITELTFELKTLNNLLHYFILHDLRAGHRSYGMNPLYWNFTYKNISSYLKKFGFIPTKPMNFFKRKYLDLVLKLKK